MSQPHQVRITTVGDGAIGKTCLLLVFQGKEFIDDYEPTIFESTHELRNFQGKQYLLHIWDTAGQEDYDRLRPMSYSKCDVAIICFALNDRETLKNAETKWKVEIAEFAPKAAILLIGTKADLWNQEDKDAIKQSEIDALAAKIGAFKTLNCSAKTKLNVEGVFDLAIEAYLAKQGGGCNIA